MVLLSVEDLTNNVASPISARDLLGHVHGIVSGGVFAELALCELTVRDECLPYA